MNTKRFTSLFLVAMGVLLTPRILHATSNVFFAGTCRPKSANSYLTISDAVAAASPGATVEVCPGTYPEQVVINTPLTLEGITVGNASGAVIVPPATGLAPNATSIFNLNQPIAAQVLVETGPVNITNITVDGTNNLVNGTEPIAGIFYESGSSGTVNQVTARNQIDNGLGLGIQVENGTSTLEIVTIEKSDIHNVDSFGIVTYTTPTQPTLTISVNGNTLAGPGIYGIYNLFGTGTIENNNVVSEFVGINDIGSNVTISGNTTTALNGLGILLEGTSEVATGNLVINNSGPNGVGIYLDTSGATVQDNKIVNSNIAIEFFCNTGTVLHNTILDAAIGIDQVPSSQTGVNGYSNVGTIRTDCQ